MIPVLQQMFAPLGAAMNLAENGAADPGQFDLGMPQSGADLAEVNPTDGFAAIFVAQETAKMEFAASEAAVFVENGNISAEALMDAGALFALRLPIIPRAMPIPQDTMLAGMIGPQPVIEATAVPATVALPRPTPEPAVFGTKEGMKPNDHSRGAEVEVPQMAEAQSDSLPALPQAALGGETFQKNLSPPTVNAEGALMADLRLALVTAPQIAADAGDQKVDVTPQSIAQMPQILPILSSPPITSLAEAMFQTQIDRDEVLMTKLVPATGVNLAKPAKAFAALQDEFGLAKGDALEKITVLPAETAIQTLNDPDGVTLTEPTTDFAPAEPDVTPTAPSPVLPDLAQNVTQDMGGDGQPLPAKIEVMPLQGSAQTFAPAPNVPPNAPPLAPQLAAQILPHSDAAKTGSIEVLLNPAELGHLRFEIHQKGENVQVVLSAERPETLELLRRNGDQLASEFRTAGFAGASLSFGQWGRSSDGQPPASFLANADEDFVPVITTQTTKPPMAQDNSRNLNLRL